MCFRVKSCMFCIKLHVATKLIAFIYMVSTFLSAILYSFPLVILWDELPLMKIYFNGSMATASITTFVACCLLINAESRKKANLMWPFVVVAVSTGMSLAILCLYGTFEISFRTENQQGPKDKAFVISSYFTYSVFLLYSAAVVHSRRQELVMERIQEASKEVMCPIKDFTNDVV